MTPNIDLMLATIERALEVSILPNATNPSAREEASLALLFTRWIRDVADHVSDAERVSAEDCRAAWADVRSLVAGKHPLGTESPSGESPRDEARAIKAALAKVLQELRASGSESLAQAVRLRLFDLGVREIERERAFGRAARLDPEWSSIPTLAEQVRKDAK